MVLQIKFSPRSLALWMLLIFHNEIYVAAVDVDDVKVAAAAERNHWLVHYPSDFHDRSDQMGVLVDNRNNSIIMHEFRSFADVFPLTIGTGPDGEASDSVEHFFWGQTGGTSLELGALDGSPGTDSMTYDLEKRFSWKRILVDGNPMYRTRMALNSPKALSVNAAVCEKERQIHYDPRERTGGIVEFMNPNFLQKFHPDIYYGSTPPGDLATINWSKFPHVQAVDCIPLTHVFEFAKVQHINFFILDVEGAELEVLKSIDWTKIKFDVICIETDPGFRPEKYSEIVTAFMKERGYINYSGQQGRNTWFTRSDFVPKKRPGLEKLCFNCANKGVISHQKKKDPVNTPEWKPCPVVAGE